MLAGPAGSAWNYSMAQREADCIPCLPGAFQNGTGAAFCAPAQASGLEAQHWPCPANLRAKLPTSTYPA